MGQCMLGVPRKRRLARIANVSMAARVLPAIKAVTIAHTTGPVALDGGLHLFWAAIAGYCFVGLGSIHLAVFAGKGDLGLIERRAR